MIDGGDLAFDREEIPMQPAGWQPEEDDAQLDELRLNGGSKITSLRLRRAPETPLSLISANEPGRSYL